MKWLILSEKNKNLTSFKNFVSEVFSEAEFTCGNLENLSEINENEIAGVSAVVLFCEGNEIGVVSFFSGFCAGTGAKFFVVCEKNEIQNAFYCKFSEFFNSEEQLKDYLLKSAEEIIQKNKQKEAFCFLFKNGYPFDGDNFAKFIEKDKEEICRAYIEAGMSVDSVDSDGTPMLNVAVRADNLAAVKWLVDCGADINSVSKDRGYTPVMDAVWRGNLEIAKYFVEHGATLDTINKEGQTMLILSVGSGRADIVNLLAENGADPDIADSMGMSAYGYAKLFKKEEICSILEKYHKEQ